MNKIQELVENSDGIVILAGAGMGVDAGIPDFRGKDGIWNFEHDTFMRFATADSFEKTPLDAWNFYITRLICYKDTPPHQGYYDLLKLQTQDRDVFAVTSNVDGHFLKAGYDENKIFEIHGDLRHVQCSRLCTRDEWPMPEFSGALQHERDIPQCPHCSAPLRPKVLMFNDPYFWFDRVDAQQYRYSEWARDKKNILGIEIGAGLTVPSIRMFGNERTHNLIRINPHEFHINRPQDIAIQDTALGGINAIFEALAADE